MTTNRPATRSAHSGLPDPPPFEPFRRRTEAALFASMPDHFDRLSWSADRVRELQTRRLRLLLARARTASPFHAGRLAEIDPSFFALADLPRLPVMDKSTMMERFDDVVTDRRLRRTDLEAIIAATGADPIPSLGEYLVLTSGGSSGTRGIFVMEDVAVAEFVASTMRLGIAISLAEGGPPPGGLRAALIAAGSPIHATGVGRRFMESGAVRTSAIPATLPFDEIVARIRDLDPDLVMGYPSVLDGLAAEQEAGRLALHPRAVTCTAENLSSAVRTRIEAAFGAPVANLYGSTEGLTGVSRPGDVALTFASDCCITELVDERDQPVPPGEPAAAVLVTNLFNLAQPLIRYRIEDRFVEQAPAPDHGHLRAVVDGRTSDTLSWGDVVVHPLSITNELVHTPAIVDYVVRQTGEGVAIGVVTVADVDLADLTERIRRDLSVAGLMDAVVTIERIDDVGRDAHTGKVARIVPR